MIIRVTQKTKRGLWRAEPIQLPGVPPNGIGPTPEVAVEQLRKILTELRPDGPDGQYVSMMKEFGWPEITIDNGHGFCHNSR